jgi:fatty-acid desaturase
MIQTATAQLRPWDQPFWKPVPGKIAIFSYLVIIHLLALAGLILFPLPGWKVLAVTLFLSCWGGLGTTVCYHRLLSHRTLKLNPIIEHILIFGTMFNGSGAPATWVAYHRRHHARADTEEDISSPKHGGFWWAHIRWLYQSESADVTKWSPDLDKGIYRFWTAAEVPVIVVALLAGLTMGWPGFFWIGAIRLVYALHMQCLVNSLTHLGHADKGDSSMNVWWLGPLQLTAWGENWHKNHHDNAGSARLGNRWWQTDIGWYFITAMEAVSLASHVKRPVRVRR